jgi:hypothetical protein
MDQFGVQKPALKKIARTPELPELQATTSLKTTATHYWQGAKVKDLEGEEFSAFGVSKDSGGVQLLEAPDNALQAGDLIQSVNGQPVKTVAELFRGQDAAAGKPLMIGIVRGQKPSQVRIEAYTFVSIGNGTPTANGVPVKAITTQPATSNEPAASLGDGKLATNYGPVFGNGIGNGKYKTDLGAPVGIAAISTWSYNQNGNRGPQRFVVFGSNAPTDPGWNVANRNTFTPIAEVDTAGPGIDKFQMTTIRMTGKPALGSFRWLVWSVAPVTSQAENTAYQEVQISPAP